MDEQQKEEMRRQNAALSNWAASLPTRRAPARRCDVREDAGRCMGRVKSELPNGFGVCYQHEGRFS